MNHLRVMHGYPFSTLTGAAQGVLGFCRGLPLPITVVVVLLSIFLSNRALAQVPLVAVVQPGTIVCMGDSTEIILLADGGTPPYQFSRDGVHFQSSPAIQGLTAGLYSNLTVMDSVGSVFQLPPFQLANGTMQPDNYYIDSDDDGFGAGTPYPRCADPGSGFSLLDGDCNDSSDKVNPLIAEVCNAIDDDCDGLTDDSLVVELYYTDADGDRFGAGSGTWFCEDPGDAYATNDADCDDSNPLINPAVHEEFNGIDDNCNGMVDFDDPYPPDTCGLVLTAQGHIACHGGTADITLNIAGGTAPYTLGSGATSGLSPGVYTYSVIDAAGCVSTVTHTLTDPDLLEVQVSSPGIACFGEEADVHVVASGGTGPYTDTGIFTRGPGLWTFVVTDSSGCSAQAQLEIQEPAPLDLQVTAGAIQCNGGNALVVVSANGGVQPYSGTGTYHQPAGTQVYGIVDANGCTADTVLQLTQPDNLPDSLTWSGLFTACVPAVNGSTSFSVDPVSDGLNTTVYNWIPPTGMTITTGQGTPQVTVSWTGTSVDKSIHGLLTLNLFNGCVNRTVTRTVSYSTSTPVTPSSISGPSRLCPGDTAIYSFSPVTRATRYSWTIVPGMKFIGDSTSNVVVLLIQPNYTGGTIAATAWNACGGSPARSRSVTLNHPLTPGSIAGQNSGLCGMTGVAYSIAPVSGANSYQWSVPSGATILSGQGTTQITINFIGSSTGMVKVRSVNQCGSSPDRSLSVALVPARPDPITANPGGAPCAGTLVGYAVPTVMGAQTYAWSATSGAMIQSGQGTKSVAIAWTAASANTSQSVTVRASNACGNSNIRALSLVIGSCLRIEDDREEDLTRSKVYPNPAHGSAFVSYVLVAPGVVEFRLSNITGHVLHVVHVQHDSEGSFVRELPIQALGLPPGVYVITVSRDGMTENVRLVVR